MARLSRWWPALVVGTVLGSAPGRADLPVVAGADFKQLRDDCRRLLRALDSQKAPFPAATQKALRTLLDGRAEDAEAAAEQVQKLLATAAAWSG